MSTIPTDVLESIEPQRQQLLVTLSGRDEPVICRYATRSTETMIREGEEISQRFAGLEPIDPAELGNCEEIMLTWTVDKAPATLVGCLWVWDSDVEAYRWDAKRVTAISVDKRAQRS